jgi:Arc/MetJ-type ribon-helix-helix transcriptional regulator
MKKTKNIRITVRFYEQKIKEINKAIKVGGFKDISEFISISVQRSLDTINKVL